MSAAEVSVVICTRNRADHLEKTLRAMAEAGLCDDLRVEVLVVDNASTDATREVASGWRLPGGEVRYRLEPRVGQSVARNTGLAEARGQIIVFTDDDVRPADGWLRRLCAPIVEGRGHAVVGSIGIPEQLDRPWMKPLHRAYMASSDALDMADPKRLIGANMAVSRDVLAMVPWFDPELGPGALGFEDETLFSRQLREAGFKIVGAPDARLEHHFDPDRLDRARLLDSAWRHGRSGAYVRHHWMHEAIPEAARRYLRAAVGMMGYRWSARARQMRGEPCTESELRRLSEWGDIAQYVRERRRSRNYDRRGVVKVRGVMP